MSDKICTEIPVEFAPTEAVPLPSANPILAYAMAKFNEDIFGRIAQLVRAGRS